MISPKQELQYGRGINKQMIEEAKSGGPEQEAITFDDAERRKYSTHKVPFKNHPPRRENRENK